MSPTALYVASYVLPAAAKLLPEAMNAPAAWRHLMAIGFQESGFSARVQRGGPARGFWQFERGGGVVGVLAHEDTRALAANVCHTLCYDATPSAVYVALSDNDVLAAVFARLLLWTDPRPLPTTEPDAWTSYVDTWRPGAPRRAAWPHSWMSGRWSLPGDLETRLQPEVRA